MRASKSAQSTSPSSPIAKLVPVPVLIGPPRSITLPPPPPPPALRLRLLLPRRLRLFLSLVDTRPAVGVTASGLVIVAPPPTASSTAVDPGAAVPGAGAAGVITSSSVAVAPTVVGSSLGTGEADAVAVPPVIGATAASGDAVEGGLGRRRLTASVTSEEGVETPVPAATALTVLTGVATEPILVPPVLAVGVATGSGDAARFFFGAGAGGAGDASRPTDEVVPVRAAAAADGKVNPLAFALCDAVEFALPQMQTRADAPTCPNVGPATHWRRPPAATKNMSTK